MSAPSTDAPARSSSSQLQGHTCITTVANVEQWRVKKLHGCFSCGTVSSCRGTHTCMCCGYRPQRTALHFHQSSQEPSLFLQLLDPAAAGTILCCGVSTHAAGLAAAYDTCMSCNSWLLKHHRSIRKWCRLQRSLPATYCLGQDLSKHQYCRHGYDNCSHGVC